MFNLEKSLEWTELRISASLLDIGQILRFTKLKYFHYPLWKIMIKNMGFFIKNDELWLKVWKDTCAVYFWPWFSLILSKLCRILCIVINTIWKFLWLEYLTASMVSYFQISLLWCFNLARKCITLLYHGLSKLWQRGIFACGVWNINTNSKFAHQYFLYAENM